MIDPPVSDRTRASEMEAKSAWVDALYDALQGVHWPCLALETYLDRIERRR
ncbi:MAG: hypothetical protein AAFQ79_17065 [Pseudomonadota bacterium]